MQRVRSFLGANFYWHQRLAKSGADLEVIQTLQSMIRGESVVLVAEQSRTGGVGIAPAPKPKGLPSLREELMTNLGMSYDAATAYMIRYNEIVEKIHAMEASCASRAAGDITKTATPLGDARPFEYAPDTIGDAEQEAGVFLTPAEEMECETQYEADMGQCSAYWAMQSSSWAMCKERAMQRYARCLRGM